MILLNENSNRGGANSIMGNRYVKSDDSKKIIYTDAKIIYGHSMPQRLNCDGIEIWHRHPDHFLEKLEEISKIRLDSDFGYINEVDLNYPIPRKQNRKNFPYAPGNNGSAQDKFNIPI